MFPFSVYHYAKFRVTQVNASSHYILLDFQLLLKKYGSLIDIVSFLILHQLKGKHEKEKEKKRCEKMKERIKYRLKNGAARSHEFNETTRLSLILCEKSSSSARLRASYLPISTATLSLAPFQESPEAGYYDLRAIALRGPTSARIAALKNRHC